MIQPGDIVFIHGTDWVSRAIERITKSKYSHVAVYIGNGYVIEAQGWRTVGLQRLSHYQGEYDVYRIPMKGWQREFGLQWLYNQRMREYDYWDCVVLFFRCLFHFKIPWHEGHRIICSRLTRDYIAKCGVYIPDANMTPEDLFEWVKQRGRCIAA